MDINNKAGLCGEKGALKHALQMDQAQLLDRWPVLLVVGFVFARLAGILGQTLEGLRGYGDFQNFFHISSLPGWPFINYWVEFPPVFPFINTIINRLAGGQEHTYDYLLVFLLLLADAGSLYLFARLAQHSFNKAEALARSGAYLMVLLTLAYSWWYFDPLAVFFMLLGLWGILGASSSRRPVTGGLAVGLGVATKLFPGLALLAAWRRYAWKRLAVLSVLSIAPLLVLYGLLYAVSPAYTSASIHSQSSKGSWETVWSLLDGNLRTGNFGSIAERIDPAAAWQSRGNPPVIPPLVSLLVFGGVGLWGMIRACPQDDRQSLALVGFGLSLLLLWSPGWSPQWVLYLLPLVLLALPARQAFLFGAALVLVNLLEWPVMLSRGMFSMMWVTIVIRTMIMVLLAVGFYDLIRRT